MDSRESGPPPDKDSETKPAVKKKKSTTQLGGFVLAPRKSDKDPDVIDTAWSKLTLTKRRHGQTVEAVPLARAVSENTLNQPHTSAQETQRPLPVEELTQDETQLVVRHIASERQAVEPETAGTDDSNTEGYAATAAEAINSFRSKIIHEGHQIEHAFIETMHELEVSLKLHPEPVTEMAGVELPLESQSSESPVIEELPSETTQLFSASQQAEVAKAPEVPQSFTPSRRSTIAPAATELRPRGSGMYHLNTFARKDGQPSTEHMPLHDEFTLRNLPGGTVGYLIGRRRGRIKTEKKLAATRKELEAEIDDLQESIITKENHIRKVVHMSKKESYEASQQLGQENSRVLAMEANQLHGKQHQHPAERIGHVLISGKDEQLETKADKKSAKLKPAAEKITVDKRVETMSRAELLHMSEEVHVDNTTLRQVYETHLVSEQGLRQLVSEYVRGADVHEALREELVEHEIDFERDPILRDRRKQRLADSADGETLNTLLERANAMSQSETEDELAVLKARQQHHETQRERQQGHRRVMDVSMIAAITVLFILVVILLSRGR